MHIGILISHIVPESLSSNVISAGFMIQKRPNQHIIKISHALANIWNLKYFPMQKMGSSNMPFGNLWGNCVY